MRWSVDFSRSEFVSIPWSAPKKDVDCLIPFWSRSQTLLQARCMWLPLEGRSKGREGGRKWTWIEYVYYHIVATSWNSLFQAVSITVWGGLNWLCAPGLYYIGLWHHLLQLMKKHTTSYTKCCVGLKYSMTKPNQSACENLSHLLKDWHFPSQDSLIKLHVYHT